MENSTEKTIIAFDIESTGIDTVKDRIVQLAMVKCRLSDLSCIEKKVTYVNPLIPIPIEASEIHHITDEMVKTSPTFQQISKSVFAYINTADLLLTHNGKSFDRSMLHEEFLRCGLNWEPKPMVDTYTIMSNSQPRTLEGAYRFYCGKDIEKAHDALGDVYTTIEILRGQISMYAESPKEIEEWSTKEKLISESKYKDEDSRLSWDGKIILNKECVSVLNFGQHKGKTVSSLDLGYINWMLQSDFASQTKNVLKSLINK